MLLESELLDLRQILVYYCRLVHHRSGVIDVHHRCVADHQFLALKKVLERGQLFVEREDCAILV